MAVGAGVVPMLGMLMLPKTICYVLMITVFCARQPLDICGRRKNCNRCF